MFKYACFKEGIEFSAIDAVDAGTTDEMEHAFRDGEGDYIHAQGPTPQQLEKEGVGHVVASVGEAIGVCAFSSLAATRDWQNSDMATAFMRAYRDARKLINSAPASEIAKIEKEYFPRADVDVLTDTIGFYQRLGCWTPHVEITREAFEGALDVFLHAGSITTRHDYEFAVSSPPAA
jgi:NitT/TauT family transport system substrate-binding protein